MRKFIVPKFQGGLQEIVKALELMNPEEQQRLFTELNKRDPEMVERIKNSLHRFEDIQYVTPKMLVTFMSRIDLQDLALCLKLYSEELRAFFYKNISSGNAERIRDIIHNSKVKKSVAQESRDRVLETYRKMVQNQELIPSKNDDFV
jgi:flagellar motor switch protein FliG